MKCEFIITNAENETDDIVLTISGLNYAQRTFFTSLFPFFKEYVNKNKDKFPNEIEINNLLSEIEKTIAIEMERYLNEISTVKNKKL